MPYSKSTKIRSYYEKTGKGKKLLFLGGVGGDLRSRPNVFSSPLPRHFEVLAFDHRGTGRSDKPEHDYTMLDYTHDAIALLDEHNWQDCLVVGVSFGGMVAQELAIRFPERVKAMALACTTSGGNGGSSYPIHELIHLNPIQRSQALLSVVDLRHSEQWQLENPVDTQTLLSLAADDTSPFLKEPGGAEGFARQVMARSQHNTYDRLPQIKAPTLVCAGKYDGQAPLAAVKNLQARIHTASLKVFEGGHGFLGQDPSAYREITQFLSNVETNDCESADSQ